MAAANFTIYVEETTGGGDIGSGPYTLSVRYNPTTAPSGGTEILANTNATNPQLNIRALVEMAVNAALNKVTNLRNTVDVLN